MALRYTHDYIPSPGVGGRRGDDEDDVCFGRLIKASHIHALSLWIVFEAKSDDTLKRKHPAIQWKMIGLGDEWMKPLGLGVVWLAVDRRFTCYWWLR